MGNGSQMGGSVGCGVLVLVAEGCPEGAATFCAKAPARRPRTATAHVGRIEVLIGADRCEGRMRERGGR